MIPEQMLNWGAAGCAIREIAAYGEQRAKIVGEENVFNFTIGSPSVKAPDCIEEAIQEILRTVPVQKLHAYTPAAGIYEVRKAMADYLSREFKVSYQPEDIFMTSGASSALAIITSALLMPGDELLTVTPYFSEYQVFAQKAGASLVAVPSDPDTFQLDLAAMEKAITPKTAAVLLNSPNNPSGVVLKQEGLEALARLLTQKSKEYGHTVYIIADEPYRELVYGGVKVPFLPEIYKDTVYIYSFSKSLSLAGERIGYLAVSKTVDRHDEIMNAIAGANRALGYINVTSLFQLVAAKCIGKTADISIYAKNRNLLFEELSDMGYTFVSPDGAFYLFLKTPGKKGEFCQRALERDLLLVPGEEFCCEGYARLAYCVPYEKLKASMPVFRLLAREFGLK